MRLPWQKRPEATVDPRRHHAFRSASEGVGALMPVGGATNRQMTDIASANAVVRNIGCAVPGCGKPQDDLVHAPEE